MATDSIHIFDTTLRDGEQSAGVGFSLDDKVEIARALDAIGVDVVEAGFPSSSAAESEAVRAVAKCVERAQVCALTRALPDDVDLTWQAIRDAARPRIHVFLSTSTLHLREQLDRPPREVFEMISRAVGRAAALCPDVEFSPMDATRSSPDVLCEAVRRAIDAGAATISLPDTVGAARPDQISELFLRVQSEVPEASGVTLSFHGQDDLGLATANALAAIAAGARQLEVTVNGIGERAGNTSFEEVVMAIALHGEALGVHTGIDTSGIHRLSTLVERRSGLAIAANKPIVGRNAFRHASGIHQDGVLKHRETYEAIDPAAVGHPVGTEIVLGKLSGRHGFASRLSALGIDPHEPGFDSAFARFQERAEREKEVSDRALLEIWSQGVAGRTRPPRGEAWPGPGI